MREKFSYFNLHDQAGQWRSFFLKKDSAKKYYEHVCRLLHPLETLWYPTFTSALELPFNKKFYDFWID